MRAQPVDGEGRPLERRDPQHTRGVAFDTSLSPADPQAVRFAVPADATRVVARLRYRKFSLAYAKRACAKVPRAERQRCEDVPVVEIAQVEVDRKEDAEPGWERLVDRGLALAASLADSASAAQPFLERARALAPARPEPLLGLARLYVRLGQTDEAVAMARAAARLAPEHPAAAFLEATALERAYRHAAARPAAERLLALLPEDRAALALVARVRGVVGDATGALAAADRLISIDPELEDGLYQRTLALADLGRAAEADVARARYLDHRVATEIDLALREKWRSHRSPDAPDESIPLHVHTLKRLP